jgi:hypothetical protein
VVLRPVPGGSAPCQRRLDFLELLEPFLGRVARRAVLGVGHIFLRVLHLLGELRGVDVGDGDRQFGEDGDTGGIGVGRSVVMNGAWPFITVNWPSLPGTTTWSTGSDMRRRSGETSSNWKGSAMMMIQRMASSE